MLAQGRSLSHVVCGLSSMNNATYQEKQLWLVCRMYSGSN